MTYATSHALRTALEHREDIDLGLREELRAPDQFHARLIRTLSTDPHGDGFELVASPPEALNADGAGLLTGRVNVNIELPNSLAFAGIPSTTAEVIDLHRHAAEKLHAMLRTFGERDNSRVRDLYDLSLLIDHELLEASRLAERVR